LKNNRLLVIPINFNNIFQFNKFLFLKDVPYIAYGAVSLFLNFNNNFILKNND